MTTQVNIDFLLKVLLIVGVSWLPVHLVNTILKRIYPSKESKIMKEPRKLRDALGIIILVLIIISLIYGFINVDNS